MAKVNAMNSLVQCMSGEQKMLGTMKDGHKKLSSTIKRSKGDEIEALVQLAELELRRRDYRSRHLPPEFIGDAPWAMLLDLFASEQRGRTRSETDLCESSSISPTTAMRWLNAIDEAGYIMREPRLSVSTHRNVSLTDKGRDSVSSVLSLAFAET